MGIKNNDKNKNQKIFWHVTPKYNRKSILKHGIKQSEEGHYGCGVYCIEENDFNSLQIILNGEWFRDNEILFEDLCVIKFFYDGDIEYFIPTIKNYRDEKWVVIKENVRPTQIIEFIDSQKFIELRLN